MHLKRTQVYPGIATYPLPAGLAESVVERLRGPIETARALHDHSEPHNVSLFPVASPQTGPLEDLREHLWRIAQDYAALTFSPILSGEDLLLAVGLPTSRNRPHHDSKWFMYRTASSVTYLNPVAYEGGELLFPLLDLTVRPDVPSTVFFPAGIPFRHQTTRVRSGMRLSLRAFWSDLPPEESHPRVRHLNLG